MPVPIEAETIGELVGKAASRFGDAEAVVGEGTRLTFRQLEDQSRILALRLIGRGVGKHSHVGVSFGNNPDFIVSFLAVARIGAVAVPISTFAPGRELLRLIRLGDLAAILTTRSVVGVDQVERLEAAIPGLAAAASRDLRLASVPNLRWIEFVDAGHAPPAWVSARDDGTVGAAADDALLKAVEGAVVGTDVALMIHTSGTTSDPKGVPHLHDTVCFRARYLAERMQYHHGQRTYTSQVLFWIGGLTMSLVTNIAAGGTSVWSERFDATKVLSIIESERITRLAIYPHQVEQLLAHPDFESTDRTALRVCDRRLAPGGAATTILTPEGHRMALGMSETFGPYSWGSGGTTAIAPIQDVQPGLEIRVVDHENKPVSDGETGEIVLRGRCVTPGYYKQPRSVGFDTDSWFHTGDRGTVDGDSIHFLGRMTEMIKTSGANVAPAEVVEALLAIDGIRDAYVLPVPDPVRGELVAAAVVAEPDTAVDPEAIRVELRKDLSPFKVPAMIAAFDSAEIPWTPTFKIRRHLLADMILERTEDGGDR
jgi:acyl-CoA synthetase (AMP-forming)/AMP-acid ligase II